MKKYVNPEIAIENFSVEDIITLSAFDTNGGLSESLDNMPEIIF